MTTADVIQKYNEFYVEWNGKPIEFSDSSNLWQCMDEAGKWCEKLGIPYETIRHLYAFQAWTQPLDVTLQHFWVIPNTPNGIPHTGDLVIWGQGVGVAGHIAVANGVGTVSTFNSLDQNWGGARYCRIVTHPYDNVLGWLRPITSAPMVDTGPLQAQINNLQSKIDKAKADNERVRVDLL